MALYNFVTNHYRWNNVIFSFFGSDINLENDTFSRVTQFKVVTILKFGSERGLHFLLTSDLRLINFVIFLEYTYAI